MNEVSKKRNEALINQLVDWVGKRNMTGYYAESKEKALEIAKELLKDCKTVATGGSTTLVETGIMDELKSGKYTYLDRKEGKTPEEQRAIEKEIFDCDCFLGSCNAVTAKGVLINIDGNSNRVSMYAYGPKKVVLVVGVNKICSTTEIALDRARNEAATRNTQRFDLDVPCKKTGSCMNCMSMDTICCEFLITRFSRHKNRIHIIFVNDALGF